MAMDKYIQLYNQFANLFLTWDNNVPCPFRQNLYYFHNNVVHFTQFVKWSINQCLWGFNVSVMIIIMNVIVIAFQNECYYYYSVYTYSY